MTLDKGAPSKEKEPPEPKYRDSDINALIVSAIVCYKNMEKNNPESVTLQEIKRQYADMAAGGDGGEAVYTGEPIEIDEGGEAIRWQSVRTHEYLGYPNRYFEEVCDLLGWER